MPEPSKSFPPGRACCLSVFLFATLLTVCAGGNAAGASRSSSSGGPGAHTYRNSYFGFRFEYPSGFRARAVQRNYTMVSFKRFVVTNAAAGTRSVAPYAGDLSKLPARSVVFLIEHMDGGPGPALDQPEAHFPLRSTSFAPVRGVSLPKGASWREHGFSANGWNLGADVYFGARASRADRAAVWRIVSSLRFESLRTGQRAGNGFLVLKRASSYPVGFVGRRGSNVFLIRARHGFYGISGMAWKAPSHFPCPLRFERAGFQFTCANGTRRWDRIGRPLWKGASFRDYLGVLVAVKVGQDGHVLFSCVEVGSGSPALERRYWG
jgi:hypothetical protein